MKKIPTCLEIEPYSFKLYTWKIVFILKYARCSDSVIMMIHWLIDYTYCSVHFSIYTYKIITVYNLVALLHLSKFDYKKYELEVIED